MESKCTDDTLHMCGMYLNLGILRKFEDTFSLDMAKIFCFPGVLVFLYKYHVFCDDIRTWSLIQSLLSNQGYILWRQLIIVELLVNIDYCDQ